MDRYMLDVQARMLQLLGDGEEGDGAVRTIITRTPGGFGASDDFNSGAVTIFLKPWEDRDVSTADVVGEVNRILAHEVPVTNDHVVRRHTHHPKPLFRDLPDRTVLARLTLLSSTEPRG